LIGIYGDTCNALYAFHRIKDTGLSFLTASIYGAFQVSIKQRESLNTAVTPSTPDNPRKELAEACVRSMVDDAGVDLGGLSSALPQISDEQVSLLLLRQQRGALDALALRHAYHDASLHSQLSPEDAVERALFDVFEQERFESIGCNAFAGVQMNLDARRQQVGSGALVPAAGSVVSAQANPVERFRQAVHLLCKQCLRRRVAASSLHSDAYAGTVNTTEYASIWQVFAEPLSHELGALVDDQQGFALKVRVLLKQWRRQNAASELAGEMHAGSTEHAELQDPSAGVSDGETHEADEALLEAPQSTPAEKDAESRAEDEVRGEAAGESAHIEALVDQLLDEAPMSGTDPLIHISGEAAAYKAYTTEFDEICHASAFSDQQALIRWRSELDGHIDVHARLVRRLAARLQRVLLARQRRHWQFDMEEGQLDSSRLSRIVTQPLVPLSFKNESETNMRDTTITLLIDNSRSMLGRPIMIAAAATDILARTLERCGVSVEILGFSTAHLHGGRSTQQWERDGCPENPGRLNDLRHIIYKSADTPYRKARRHLGLMLDKDILKQNIDGEALLWAYSRLSKRTEKRRILMIISDGAPVDTSTLSANSGDYLARHLQQVAMGIERARDVELLAIGIGHDVARFYSHALSVFDARQLGPVMLHELESLLRRAA